MADFKCKQCGNILHPEEGQTVITCNRCDTTMSIMPQDDERKFRMLEEADELRIQCYFERAMNLYSNIIAQYPEEGTAYWGYVLSLYGVEFKEDARTGKDLPTLHRISQSSILSDPYFKKACEYANPLDANEYQRIARELERIRKRFMELSGKEENQYDIFISFKQTDEQTHRETPDSAQAEILYYKLKDEGYRVFFSKVTLQDRAGEDYEPIIYTALNTSKIMLLIGSCREYMEAPWVSNEWTRFLDMIKDSAGKKLLIPILIGEMSEIDLPGRLSGTQALGLSGQRSMDRLMDRITSFLPSKKKQQQQMQAGAYAQPKKFEVTEESLLENAAYCLRTDGWEAANITYKRVLDVNPGSAQARMGMILAREKSRSLSEYQKRLTDNALNASPIKVLVNHQSVGGTDVLTLEKALEYAVPNYFTEQQIREIYPKALSYSSLSYSLEKNFEALKNKLGNDKEYQLVLELAEGSYGDEIKHFQEDMYSTIQRSVEQEQAKERSTSLSLIGQYSRQLSDAKLELESKKKLAEELREKDYNTACAVKTVQEVPDAIALLKKAGAYKDAPQRLENLTRLQKVASDIDDGSSYMLKYAVSAHEDVVKDYLSVANASRKAKFPGQNLWILMVVYCLLVLDVLTKSNFGLVAVVAGCIAGVVLWKKDKPDIAFAAFAGLHVLGALVAGIVEALCLAAIYIVSAYRKQGYVRWLLTRKKAQVSLKNIREKQTAVIEQEVNKSLNTLWMNTLGTEYTGPQLRSLGPLLEELDKQYNKKTNNTANTANTNTANTNTAAANRTPANSAATPAAPLGYGVQLSAVGPNKVKVIKTIRDYTKKGLAEATELVNSVQKGPVVVAYNLTEQQAANMRMQLIADGATAVSGPIKQV